MDSSSPTTTPSGDKASANYPLTCPDENGLFLVRCQETNPETSPSATFSNEGGTGVITITIPEDDAANQGFRVLWVRVDASALAVDDEIIATVTSTTDATSVGLGGVRTTVAFQALWGWLLPA